MITLINGEAVEIDDAEAQRPARVFLSRRNLLTLLNRLDSGSSPTTIMKCDDVHPEYPQSHSAIYVTAVEDDEYYTDREPGNVKGAPDE
jgi:hypothetical protein